MITQGSSLTNQALYQEDGYLRHCAATVTMTGDDYVVLNQTVFYPQGGGQPGDTGWLIGADGNRIEVTDTRELASGDIAHFVRPPVSFRAGQAVTAELDWERRYAHMRMHTCLHLLGSLLPFPVTGGNISTAKSRLDFDMEDTVDKDELSVRLNQLIEDDHWVGTHWITEGELNERPDLIRTLSVKPPTGAGRIRLLEIRDIDLQPCGGTHVRRTAEIGPVKVSKVEKKGRHNRRVNVVFD